MLRLILLVSVFLLAGCGSSPATPCLTGDECAACEYCGAEGLCVPDEVSAECIGDCSCGRDGCCDLGCDFDPDCPYRTCPDTPAVIDVGPLATGGDVDLLQALWNGDRYALAYYDRPRGAFFALAGEDGEIIPGSIRQLSDSGLHPRIDFDGDQHAVVYVEEDETAPDPFANRRLVFERVDAAGEPVAGSRVGLDAGLGGDEEPSSPVIAHDPGRREWLVVWRVGSVDAIYALRLDQGGAIVPGSLVRISPEGVFADLGGGGATGNVVAWVDGDYVISWLEAAPGGVHLTRLDPDAGIVSDEVLRQDTQQPFGAALTWSGDELAVAWYDVAPGAEHFDVRFARASRDGTFIAGSERSWGAPSAHATSASLSWDGREYAVGWWTQADASTADARVTHVSRSGAVTGSQVLTTGQRRPFFPFLSWDGCRTVVAYVDDAAASFDGRLVFLPRRPIVIE